MNELNVTVLLPTIGREFLNASVVSVLASRGLGDLELIVIDDSVKQDVSLDHADVIVVRTGGNKGYFSALNLGAMQATHDYVALMNDDDLISPNRLFKQAEVLASNNVGFCVSKLKKFAAGYIFHANNWVPMLNYNSYDPLSLAFGPIGADATLMMNSRIVPRNCFKNISLDQFGDWQFALQFYRTYGIKGLNEVTYFYRQHGNQLSALEGSREPILEIYDGVMKFLQTLNLPILEFKNFCQLTVPRHYGFTAEASDFQKLFQWFKSVDWQVKSQNPNFIKSVFFFKMLGLSFSSKIPIRDKVLVLARMSLLTFFEKREK